MRRGTVFVGSERKRRKGAILAVFGAAALVLAVSMITRVPREGGYATSREPREAGGSSPELSAVDGDLDRLGLEHVPGLEEQTAPAEVVSVPNAEMGLRLVDATGVARSRIELEVRPLSQPTSRPLRVHSDEAGRVAIAGLAARGDVELRLGSNRWRFAPTEPPFGATFEGRAWVLPTAELARFPDVVVEPAVNRLRLVDATTERPLEGNVYLVKRVHLVDPRIEQRLGKSLVQKVMSRFALQEGWIEIGYGFHRPSTSSSGQEPRSDRDLLAVAGYRELELPSDVDVFAPLWQPELVLRMEPVAGEAHLSVLERGVPVDCGEMALFSMDTHEVLFVGAPAHDLRYGPFAGAHAAIEVVSLEVGVHGVARPSGEGDTYELEVGGETGGLRVEAGRGGHPLPPLVCAAEGGHIRAQTSNDGEVCSFERLPPGRYFVGPEEWVRQVLSSASSPDFAGSEPARVVAGETTVVQAPGDWFDERESSGSLVLAPGAPAPSLIPVYGVPVQFVTFRDSVTPIPIAPDGSYRIEAGGPRASALAVVDVWDGFVRLRAVIEPGGRHDLAESRLVLSRPGATSPETFGLAYSLGPDATSVPVGAWARKADIRVRVGSAPVNLWLHDSVEHVTLRARDGLQARIDRGPHGWSRHLDPDELFE